MERTLIRVLVGEDFGPFREFICAALGRRPGLRVISEVSDDHEAVQKAEELKPDLILLDIGLPTLNGIEAANLHTCSRRNDNLRDSKKRC